MPGLSRVGVDTAGGIIVGVLAPSVLINGQPVACLGAAVAGHGDHPHASPVMSQASSTVYAQGHRVCRAGDLASCGHPATGSSTVRAGG